MAVESGVVNHDDGLKTVHALARMPRAKARLVEWRFGWLSGTEQYKRWHPVDHLFSDWEGADVEHAYWVQPSGA